MDIYTLGEMVIDFIPGSEPDSYIRNAGGAPANVAIAVARNGLNAGFCGKVGDDDFGVFLQETLRREGVAVLCPERCAEAVTTMAFVNLTPEGERSFTFARKPGADMMLTPEDVRDEHLQNSTIVHSGSCSLSAGSTVAATEQLLRRGRELDKLVSFDMNYRNLMWNDDSAAAVAAVRRNLPYVDLLKLSEEEVEMLGGESTLPALARDNGIAVLVETLGSKGAICLFQGHRLFVEGLKAEKVVDTTGAGDAFWGGFLSRLLMLGIRHTEEITESALLDALRYGSVGGCLCVEAKGAISSLPTRAQIEAYLAKHA
ncbi:MAG: carbohydrate kinase [Eubacteriales bacterium]|nr:carbohydrate kinase [Eubacteriales bacterium]